jgi:hypothetical protein
VNTGIEATFTDEKRALNSYLLATTPQIQEMIGHVLEGCSSPHDLTDVVTT